MALKYDTQLYNFNSKQYEKRSGCDILLDDAESVFKDIGGIFETAFDEKRSKWNLVSDLFRFGKSTTKLAWHGGSCIVKHTPKAIATVANAKRQLTDTITEEYARYQKEQKEEALEERIRQLSQKKRE